MSCQHVLPSRLPIVTGGPVDNSRSIRSHGGRGLSGLFYRGWRRRRISIRSLRRSIIGNYWIPACFSDKRTENFWLGPTSGPSPSLVPRNYVSSFPWFRPKTPLQFILTF